MVDGYYSLFSDLVLELLKTPRWQLKTQLDDLTTISSVLCSCLGHPRWEWRFWERMFQLMLIMLMFILRRDSHAWCNIFYFSYFCISICCTFLPAGSVIRRARKREIKKVERAAVGFFSSEVCELWNSVWKRKESWVLNVFFVLLHKMFTSCYHYTYERKKCNLHWIPACSRK